MLPREGHVCGTILAMLSEESLQARDTEDSQCEIAVPQPSCLLASGAQQCVCGGCRDDICCHERNMYQHDTCHVVRRKLASACIQRYLELFGHTHWHTMPIVCLENRLGIQAPR